MLKISWTEHKRNDKVLKQLKREENSWKHSGIDRRCAGDMCCVIASWFFGECWKVDCRGRKRPQMLLSWLLETSEKDMNYSQLKELAQYNICRNSRKQWRLTITVKTTLSEDLITIYSVDNLYQTSTAYYSLRLYSLWSILAAYD